MQWKGVGKEDMMRRRLLLLTGILLAAIPVLADPISLYNTPFGVGDSDHNQVFPIVVLISLTVEFLAIGIAVGRKLTLGQLLLSFIIIHIIVFPLATLVSGLFGYYAEMLALIIEPLLFVNAAKLFDAKVPYLDFIVVGANILSFSVGLVLFPVVASYYR